MRLSGISHCKLLRDFGGYQAAVRAAGLEPHDAPLRIDSAVLLEDWGRVARETGRIPTREEYDRMGRYATGSLEHRFERWSRVHACFLEHVEATGASPKWADVVESIRNGPVPKRGGGKSWLTRAAARSTQNALAENAEQDDPSTSGFLPPPDPVLLPPPLAGMKCVTVTMLAVLFNPERVRNAPCVVLAPRVFRDRPVMGPPFSLPGLAHEPVNEMGVVFLFGMVAHRLGFMVESLQAGFPDCEAKREVEPGRWQRLRIEFEYESRKFREHRHDPAHCDLIVCWKHNWPGCPRHLEVLELSTLLQTAACSI
jgi:hypothetical protein